MKLRSVVSIRPDEHGATQPPFEMRRVYGMDVYS
jgi:hypothetical protein